jgi:hypothetical protein
LLILVGVRRGSLVCGVLEVCREINEILLVLRILFGLVFLEVEIRGVEFDNSLGISVS